MPLAAHQIYLDYNASTPIAPEAVEFLANVPVADLTSRMHSEAK